MAWTVADIPNQTDRTFIVTGANSGLGLETTAALAAAGGSVIMACRNMEKANAAAAEVKKRVPGATLELRELNLAELSSVRRFAEGVLQDGVSVYGLINNAGIMAVPQGTTVDGFERQLGTNHFGHFALTGLLLGPIADGGGRVVTVASTAHKFGAVDFDDLHWNKGYNSWRAYGRSKLANLLFHFELNRRVAEAGLPVIAAAAHPGYAATNLQQSSAKSGNSSFKEWLFNLGNGLLAQSAADGALPSLYAATMEDVVGGDYFGPIGMGEMRGPPTRVGSTTRAQNLDDAHKLWQVSVESTGVTWPF